MGYGRRRRAGRKMHVTYDIEFYGPNTMTNTIYLGAIKGVAEMAEYLGKNRDG